MSPRLIAVALLAVPGVATAAAFETPTVRVTVLSTDGSGVRSRVWRRLGANRFESTTDPAGRLTFENMSCTQDVTIRISPINPFYANAGGWRPCETDMVITLQPVGYIGAMTAMLGDRPAAALAGGPQAGRALELQLVLHRASEAGDWGEMAFAANQLSELSRSAGQASDASRYSAIAIHSGAQLIGLEADVEVDGALLQMASDGRLVETAAANRLLVRFQHDRALSHVGRWDSATFASLRDMNVVRSVMDGSPSPWGWDLDSQAMAYGQSETDRPRPTSTDAPDRERDAAGHPNPHRRSDRARLRDPDPVRPDPL